ncbi:MAG: AEC family transporter [Povalibacter sp.]
MTALLLLGVCLVLGWLVGRFGRPPPGMAQSLNWWVINIAFSGLVLHLIPLLQFDWHLWFLPASMWFVLLGAWGFFVLLGRALHWPRARVGALTLVCGFGNTSFIGFPMVEALRGVEGLKLALFADQAGVFLALGIGGTILAALYSGRSVAPAAIARRVFMFPPFVCLLVGAAVGVFGGWPEWADTILARLGATLVPVALFSVGLQFQLRVRAGQWAPMSLALSWKLLLAPGLVWFFGYALGIEHLPLTVSVLEAAMAPMIAATILAVQHDLEPELANTVLSVGILLAFITVPIANALL